MRDCQADLDGSGQVKDKPDKSIQLDIPRMSEHENGHISEDGKGFWRGFIAGYRIPRDP